MNASEGISEPGDGFAAGAGPARQGAHAAAPPAGEPATAATAPRPRPEPSPQHDLEVLNTIHRISDSSGLNLHERLSAIVKVVAFHLRSDACSIYLESDDLPGSFVLAATHGLNAGAVGRVNLAAGEGVTGWVGRERIPLPIEDTSLDPRYKLVSEMGEEGLRSILAAPIRLEQRLIGVINVQSGTVRDYPPQQVRLLETIGMHLGGIIRAAQLYEDARKQLKQLRIINGIGQALVSTLHLDPLLRMVMEKSRELTHARGGVLRLWDEERQQLVVQVTTGEDLPEEELRPLYLGEGVAGLAALKQEHYLIHADDPDSRSRLLPEGVSKNYLCVPIVYQGRAIGTISVFDREAPAGDPARLTAEDQALLQSLANQVAVAIRNAQVCDELTATVEDLRRTRDLLVQRETLAAMGHMAEGMVQQIRRPLAPIDGLARRMLANDCTPSQQRTYLQVILNEAERLEGFVQEVMALARSESVELVRRPVDRLVAACVDEIRERCADWHIRLEASLSAGAEVFLDEEQLGAAVRAILKNAMDALPTGGTIHVRTERCTHAVDGRTSDGARISVRDSGAGIPEAVLPRLFTPFFTTRERGRGLALATAYRTVRAHGGALLAHNPPQGGAEFSLFLPLDRPGAGPR
jgi:signal transduction histidine kinase